MKNLKLGILLSVMIIVIISCGKTNNSTDPVALYAQIGKDDAPNTLTNNEKKDGWQLLFNGTTTDGWHGYNMKVFPDCWKIEDGALTMNSTGSKEDQDIITNEKYRNFALSLEYKLTKAANSGVIFQVAEDTMYKFPYETGPEFQIIDHENWVNDTLEDVQINGANYAMYPPMAKPYKPLGEWNQLFLVVKGDSVTQMLNGVVVVKYVKNTDEWKALRNSGKWSAFPDWGKYDEGFISLQNHGTKVWYRDIKLKKITIL
jgi:hypothetical protein